MIHYKIKIILLGVFSILFVLVSFINDGETTIFREYPYWQLPSSGGDSMKTGSFSTPTVYTRRLSGKWLNKSPRHCLTFTSLRKKS